MDGSNKDDGIDDVNANDGENKFDLGYVHGGGGNSNNSGRADDVGGVDFNDGDVFAVVMGKTKLIVVMT